MGAEARSRGPADSLIGTTLDGYEIVGLLGRGGMGDVYRGFDPRLQRVVAIKLVSSARANDPQFLARFDREARAASALSHPNVAQVYDTGRHGNRPFYVMEFVEGRTLARLLDEEGPLPAFRAVDYLRQASEGLGAAHEKGIVHRDMKPENLMVDGAGRLKVVDFGLARPMAAGATITQADRVMGTPQYMAPEQASVGVVDHRSDIYALGATFYHLLSGSPPFVAETSIGVMLKHVNEPLVPLSEIARQVPADLSRVIGRMLAKDPGERYQSYSEVLSALASAARAMEAARRAETAADDVTRVMASGSRASVPRRASTRGLPGWVLALIAAALGAAAALTFVSWRGASRPAPAVPSVPQRAEAPRAAPGTRILAAPPRSGPFGLFTRPRPGLELAAGARTVALFERLDAAAQEYRRQHGGAPATLADLRELRPDERVDGWGARFDLRATSSSVRIVSAGPDGRFGTPDDLVFEDGRLVSGGPPRPRSGSTP